MDEVEDVVIVGAGFAGLITALGLHRLGFRSLVLESSDSLRSTGFGFSAWSNAWRALDVVGIGDTLRGQHNRLQGILSTSMISGLPTSEISCDVKGKNGDQHEVRFVRRKALVEALQNELPSGTVRYSSKVVLIEETGYLKLLHLADGSTLRTKVLIGCDGVNSVVAKWLGFKNPPFIGRTAMRGRKYFGSGHGFELKSIHFLGKGVRAGFMPCDDKTIHWFLTCPSSSSQEVEGDPAKVKQFVLDNLGKVPAELREIVESTGLETIITSRLRYRNPWEVLWGNISQDNVCVAGDAWHPMTPDLGQGGCAAIEDGIVLARCIAEALSKKPGQETREVDEEEEMKRIKIGLQKYARERRWRCFDLAASSYIVGEVQRTEWNMITFLRDKLSAFLAGLLLTKSDFDCGKLSI